ncbi:hypothetical protein HID58_071276 [Brassica napus]|uniref:Fatty acid hydroxylase domain-containing protein n=1 Tax=Brassica napus TaxID=3708 RepID=A0ABQ7Z148_BRANA|nr:hypothetical protein HID58_071276 [Brassica napus]
MVQNPANNDTLFLIAHYSSLWILPRRRRPSLAFSVTGNNDPLRNDRRCLSGVRPKPHDPRVSLVRLLRREVRLLPILPQHPLLLIFSLVPLPLVFVELARSASGWFDRYKIQPKVKELLLRHVPLLQRRDEDVHPRRRPLQLVSYPSIQWVAVTVVGEIAAQLVVYFLVEDYTNYWVHRFFHSKGYEKIHHIHHEYTAPIGYAAPYAHGLRFCFLGSDIEAIETHSGYDFPWTLTKFIPFYGGAEYHDYHHYVGGQSQSNFASVFTYCDYIYGTDKGYRFQKKLLQQIKQESKKSNMQNGGDNSSLCSLVLLCGGGGNLPEVLRFRSGASMVKSVGLRTARSSSCRPSLSSLSPVGTFVAV